MDCLAEIITPLKEGKLLFSKMSANEGLSRMFTYEVDLLSTDKSIAFADLLGKPMTVKLELPEGDIRFFNGYVARFGFVGRRGDYYEYHATLRPWLWFLTRTQDCRIFQKQTAVDIIKAVFRDHTTAKYFAEGLIDNDKYPSRDYCVQYRETDFNFISRLLEQEGISYYFKHKEDDHTLVLVDSNSYAPVPGYEHIPYIGQTANVRKDKENIGSWSLNAEIQTGRYVLNDYDFECSKVGLEERQDKLYSSIEHDDYEVYDYPGGYTDSEAAKHYVKARIEQIQTAFIQANGKTDARGLTTGYSFELIGFPREEQNGKYLVVNTHISLVQAYRDGHAICEGSSFDCNFDVAHASNTWRPARLTPKPVVQGPQTAVVVGKKAEKKEGENNQADPSPDAGDDEIHTDKYGRVKVLFHWDREHRRLGSPENSSCWIRVSQPWAGKNFGFMAIPRVGQEVVVDFLEGDPDRPIITGRVYNDDQMPPWDLLKHKERTGIVTRSTEGGNPTTANELHFDDTKNHELIFLHAENDILTTIEQDATYIVGHDHTETIRHDRTSTVHKKDTLTVKEEGQVLRIEKGGQDEFIIGKRLFDLVGDEANTLVGERDTFITVSDTHTTPVETRVITTQADHTYGDELNISVGGGGSTTTVMGAVTHNAIGAHKLFAPSFDFTASGDVTYNCHIYTRNCYNVQDNIYGPSKNTQIGPNVQIQLGSSSYSHFGNISEVEAGAMILKFVAGVQISSRLGLDVLQYGGASINTKMGPVYCDECPC
jgi:type VI secretion system secreted protein VgrG